MKMIILDYRTGGGLKYGYVICNDFLRKLDNFVPNVPNCAFKTLISGQLYVILPLRQSVTPKKWPIRK